MGRGRVLMFSGGIGRLFYEPLPAATLAEVAVYGDIGPLLAERLRLHPALAGYSVVHPPETMRATVLGAASQLVTLSGSTIWAEKGILPLRNVPVVRPVLDGLPAPAELAAAIRAAVARWDINPAADPFAVALEINRTLDYNALVRLAEGLRDFAAQMPAARPLIAIIGRDYAQSLGQTLRPLVGAAPAAGDRPGGAGRGRLYRYWRAADGWAGGAAVGQNTDFLSFLRLCDAAAYQTVRQNATNSPTCAC